jgi:hypothetical protein
MVSDIIYSEFLFGDHRREEEGAGWRFRPFHFSLWATLEYADRPEDRGCGAQFVRGPVPRLK